MQEISSPVRQEIEYSPEEINDYYNRLGDYYIALEDVVNEAAQDEPSEAQSCLHDELTGGNYSSIYIAIPHVIW